MNDIVAAIALAEDMVDEWTLQKCKDRYIWYSATVRVEGLNGRSRSKMATHNNPASALFAAIELLHSNVAEDQE